MVRVPVSIVLSLFQAVQPPRRRGIDRRPSRAHEAAVPSGRALDRAIAVSSGLGGCRERALRAPPASARRRVLDAETGLAGLDDRLAPVDHLELVEDICDVVPDRL